MTEGPSTISIDRKLFSESMRAFIDAPVQGGGWFEPLNMVESALGVRGVVMMAYERFRATPVNAIERSAGMPMESEAIYREQFAALDDRARFCLTRPVGEIIFDHQMGDVGEMDRTLPIYRDFLRPFDIGRFTGVRLSSHGTPNGYSLFAFSKPNESEPPDGRETAYVLTAASVVQGALFAAAALGEARAMSAARAGALDALAFGVLFVNESGAVADANRAARDVLKRGVGLSISHGRLAIDDDFARARFARILSGAGAPRAVETVSLRRRDDARPLTLLVLRPDAGRALPGAPNLRPVFVIEAGAAPSPERLWAAAFGLSPVEIEVARMMSEGRSSREIAAARGVSFATVRTQMRNLYGKLGVTKASAAVRVLLQTTMVSPGER